MTSTDDGRVLRETMARLGPQVVRLLRAAFPQDLDFRLTATQRKGKMRLEFNGLYHEAGWTDSSG